MLSSRSRTAGNPSLYASNTLNRTVVAIHVPLMSLTQLGLRSVLGLILGDRLEAIEDLNMRDELTAFNPSPVELHMFNIPYQSIPYLPSVS